jgi:hypothetical protein
MFGTYPQLGVVAQERDLLEDAGDLYRKSLAIAKEPKDQREMADAFHQLGNCAICAIGWKKPSSGTASP